MNGYNCGTVRGSAGVVVGTSRATRWSLSVITSSSPGVSRQRSFLVVGLQESEEVDRHRHSPQPRQAVGVECRVDGNQRHSFDERRGGEESVKRVFVMQGERGQRFDVIRLQRQ